LARPPTAFQHRLEFARMLDQHLRNGQRPDGSALSKKPWTNQEFAGVVGVSASAVYHWRATSNPSTPQDIEPILRALFSDGSERLSLLRAWQSAQGLILDEPTIVHLSAHGNIAIDDGGIAVIRPPPETPPDGPGSKFAPTSAGYEILLLPLPEDERTDPIQVRLYARIQRRIQSLRPLIARIRNMHPILADEFDEYRALVTVGLDGLDVASVWSAGNALREMLLQFEKAVDAMTPRPEPEPLALLNSLMRDDIAFIQGFEAGRALTRRVAEFEQAAQPPGVVRSVSHDVLAVFLTIPRLLAAKASGLLNAIVMAIENSPTATLQLTVAASETARNSVIAAGRYIQSFGDLIELNEAGKLALILTGAEHPDVLEASIVLFRDHASALMALAALDSQIMNWLEWLVAALREHPTSKTRR
jgi:hypothetical protein